LILRLIQQKGKIFRDLKKEWLANPKSGSADFVISITFDRKKFETLFKLLRKEQDSTERPFEVNDMSENKKNITALFF
jgi:hypothetical protein